MAIIIGRARAAAPNAIDDDDRELLINPLETTGFRLRNSRINRRFSDRP
jgi:hypothetical protein